MLVCDGFKGLPEAVETVWPRTIVQTCVVHLLRNSSCYAARQDWDKMTRLLKPVYTAPTEEAALDRFAEFADAWGRKYPAIVKLWENAWEEVSVHAPAGDLKVESLELGPNANVTRSLSPAGSAWYRLRVDTRGRQRLRDRTSLIPVEDHLLIVWPAPPTDTAVLHPPS